MTGISRQVAARVGGVLTGASILFVGGALIVAAPAFADNGPHVSNFGVTALGSGPDGCAKCHRLHSGSTADFLLTQAQETLCMSCHGSTGTGASTAVDIGVQYSSTSDRTTVVGALRGGGFTSARLGAGESTRTLTVSGGGNKPGFVIPALAAGEASTSEHGLDETSTVWGNGQVVNVALTSATASGTAITYTTATAHGLVVGSRVAVSNNATEAFNIAGYVASVPTTTTFTLTSGAAAGGPSAGGNVGVQGKIQTTGTSATLECGSCHDPHGNNSYRILKPVGATTSGGTTLFQAPLLLSKAEAVTDAFDPTLYAWKYTLKAVTTLGNLVPGQQVIIAGLTNFNVSPSLTYSASAPKNLVTSVDTSAVPPTFTISGQSSAPATETTTTATVAYGQPNAIINATTDATAGADGTYIEYTTLGRHGLVPGQKVTVAGVTGTSAQGFNATRKTISSVTAGNVFRVAFTVPKLTTYTYVASSSASPSSGYIYGVPDALGAVGVTSASAAGGTMTYVTTLPHGLTAGQSVTVSGVSDAAYNVTGTIAAVNSATTFTIAGAGAGAATGGSVVVNNTVVPTVANVAVTLNSATGNYETTYYLSAASGLNAGQTVKITGTTDAGAYDGTFAIASISGSTSSTPTDPLTFTVISPAQAAAVSKKASSGAITLLTGGGRGSRVYATANYWRIDDHSYTGVANNVGNMGNSATAMTQVTSTQSGMILNVSQWCSTCHTRYFAASGARKYNSGDAIFKFRHRSESPGEGNPNCLQCHVAHGSNSVMDGTFSSALTNPGDPNGTGTADSRLLRMDNRGICAMCHTTQG